MKTRQVTARSSNTKWKKAWVCAALCISMTVAAGCGRQSNPTEDAAQENTKEAETKYRSDVSTEGLKAEVAKALLDNYWPNMLLGPEEMDSLLGIKAEYYDEAVAEMPMISTHVDTLIIVKAKTEQIEKVEERVNAYRDKLVNDTMQYPMNLGKIQASMVKTFGNYVCFVQLGGDAVDASDEEEIIKKCQADNEEALNAIEDMLKET